MHGGAGALLSVGLLRAVDYASFAACVEGAYLEGGDSFISLCLWDVRVRLDWGMLLHQAILTASSFLTLGNPGALHAQALVRRH